MNYKLRDAAGQAREFHNFMLPVEVDGQRALFAGVRDSPDQSFRYLRIPADFCDTGALGRLTAAAPLPWPTAPCATRRCSATCAVRRPPTGRRWPSSCAPPPTARWRCSPAPCRPATGRPSRVGGCRRWPTSSKHRARGRTQPHLRGMLLRVLSRQPARTGATVARPTLACRRCPPTGPRAFMTQSVISLSDGFHYPAPLLLSLTGFDQVRASVFQVARARAKTLVYLGAVLLIIGVFAMLYVRERRLWVWLEDGHGGGNRAPPVTLSSPRRTGDTDREFERLQRTVLGTAATPTPAPAA
ncbi:cytochrome c biogenesis protein ResB [Aquabacterium sp. J223]|nr:cytochrome c biogenesis protein ResB [Aquabacterium sp. J223]